MLLFWQHFKQKIIYSLYKLSQKGPPLKIKIDGSSSYAGRPTLWKLNKTGYPAMLGRILECRNGIFFMCIGHGYDCWRAAVFRSSGKNEILGAKSGCNSRQLITPAGTGTHDDWVVVGLFWTNLNRWFRKSRTHRVFCILCLVINPYLYKGFETLNTKY